MKVLQVISAISPRYGGTSAFILSAMKALRDNPNITVELATTDADGPGGAIKVNLNDYPYPLHIFARDTGETYKYSSGLENWLNMSVQDYDVIHAHGHWNHATKTAARAAAKAGIPFVISPHGMMSTYSWQKSWLKKRVYWWLVERKNVFSAAGFHTTSTGEQAEIRALGVKVPVENIPLGLNEEAFSTPVNNTWLRNRLPQAGAKPIVLFLSRLHPKKGIVDFLLPAMKAMSSDFFLAIAGPEDTQSPGYEAEIKSNISSFGLDSRVALLGPLNGAEKWHAFDGASIFVLPSYSENFGIVVAEAMARGTSACVTEGVQGAEHITRANAGVVVPVSIEGVKTGLEKLLAQESQREAMSSAAKSYAQAIFSWPRVAEELVRLYETVIAGGPAAHVRTKQAAGTYPRKQT